MALERLLKLIELANDENNEDEARNAAVRACRIIKREGYRLVGNADEHDRDWGVGEASAETPCDGCEFPIEPFCRYYVNRVDGKRYHGGCVP
jgi:hypothetical protein